MGFWFWEKNLLFWSGFEVEVFGFWVYVKFKGFGFGFVVCCWFSGSVKNVVFFNWLSVVCSKVCGVEIVGIWVVPVWARLSVARIPKSAFVVVVGASTRVKSMGKVFAIEGFRFLLLLSRWRWVQDGVRLLLKGSLT